MENKKIEIPKGKKTWQDMDGNTVLVAVDKVDKRPVTERIKTFEDAMKATRMALPLDENQLSLLPKDVVAYMKLRIIAAALNELTDDTLDEFPKFISGGKRWFPWFNLYTKQEIDEMGEEKKKKLLRFDDNLDGGVFCALASISSSCAWSPSFALFSARLAVKSESLAEYFGKQFMDIWADYLLSKGNTYIKN